MNRADASIIIGKVAVEGAPSVSLRATESGAQRYRLRSLKPSSQVWLDLA
jgi:hypothetical protein